MYFSLFSSKTFVKHSVLPVLNTVGMKESSKLESFTFTFELSVFVVTEDKFEVLVFCPNKSSFLSDIEVVTGAF